MALSATRALVVLACLVTVAHAWNPFEARSDRKLATCDPLAFPELTPVSNTYTYAQRCIPRTHLCSNHEQSINIRRIVPCSSIRGHQSWTSSGLERTIR